MRTRRIIDVHAHLQDEKFLDDQSEVIQRAKESGVVAIINAGTCVESSRQALSISEKYDSCFSLIGIHPHDASSFNENSVAEISQMLEHKSALAVGEIGLDYHYDFSPREKQKQVFKTLWLLAAEKQLPAIIHIREAFDDFFEIIKNIPHPPKVMLHCFSGDSKIAAKAVELGFYFSIGGPLTFKNSQETRDTFKTIPIERIHLETDCPYLAPVPKRGKRNEPAYIQHTFAAMVQLREMSDSELESQLIQNSRDFFGSKLEI